MQPRSRFPRPARWSPSLEVAEGGDRRRPRSVQTGMAAVILRLDNVSKSFGALKVSDSVTFAVPRGEALGVIGPNGAGKSTLFNLITANFLRHGGRLILLRRPGTRP